MLVLGILGGLLALEFDLAADVPDLFALLDSPVPGIGCLLYRVLTKQDLTQ